VEFFLKSSDHCGIGSQIADHLFGALTKAQFVIRSAAATPFRRDKALGRQVSVFRLGQAQCGQPLDRIRVSDRRRTEDIGLGHVRSSLLSWIMVCVKAISSLNAIAETA